MNRHTYLIVMLVACGAPDQVPGPDVAGGAAMPALHLVPESVVLEEIQPPALVSGYVAMDSGPDYFGGSDWGCCWTETCDKVRDVCEPGTVLIRKDLRHCCVTDFGQCPHEPLDQKALQ